jgi:hypothetical protein
MKPGDTVRVSETANIKLLQPGELGQVVEVSPVVDSKPAVRVAFATGWIVWLFPSEYEAVP